MSHKVDFKPSSTRNQYLSTIAVNLIALSHGCAIGWLSPSIPYLRSEDSHLSKGAADSDDISWIGSLVCLGGILGTLVFGAIAGKFGKKVSLILLVIPHITAWIIILMSEHIEHLFVARIMQGLTGGGMLRTVPLFIAEISENKIRGRLGSTVMLFFSSGTLFIFVAGTYLNFFIVPFVVMIFPTIFFISVLFLHDTPASLMSRNQPAKALESLKFYRSCRGNEAAIELVKQEFELLRKASENKDYEKTEISDFLTKPAKKGLIIGMFLVFLNQFSGTFAVTTYTSDIFKNSGSFLSRNESSIIVATIQLFGIYVSTICVEKFGRKILMTISCIGASLFLFVLATFSYLQTITTVSPMFDFIPILSVSLAIFIASLGIVSLPFVIITELLPNKIRNIGCTICMTSITLFAFIVLKIFPLMIQAFGLHGSMWFFSGICFFGAIFTILIIPETKGKSLITSSIAEEGTEMLKPTEQTIRLLPAKT